MQEALRFFGIDVSMPRPYLVRQVLSFVPAINFHIAILGFDYAIDFLCSEKFALQIITPLFILACFLTLYILTIGMMKYFGSGMDTKNFPRMVFGAICYNFSRSLTMEWSSNNDLLDHDTYPEWRTKL